MKRGRRTFLAGLVLFAVFLVAAGGAAPRYNRIVLGAWPLAAALICLGFSAYVKGAAERRRSLVGLAIVCWAFALAALAVWARPALAGVVRPDPRMERAHVLVDADRDRLRAALFAELQPVALSGCELERFGDPADGGYLMCGNLLGSIRAGYSYGIAGTDQWGCEVSRRFAVQVHQYDCFDLRRPECPAGRTVFNPECVGPVRKADEEGRVFDTVEAQLVRNGNGSDLVVVKMDVEGAEWEALSQTPSSVLERIEQLAIEFHGVGLDHQLMLVRRLKQFFHVAHLHFNNNTCKERIDPFPSWVYEVLLVNKRLATPKGPAALPHPLDAPNNPDLADCQAPTSRWSHALPASLRFLLPASASPDE